MTTKIIARKYFANAVAFIEVDQKGNCSVYGKFYINGCGHSGPQTGTLHIVPKDLAAEVRNFKIGQSPSPKLKTFLDIVWAKAKKENSWFQY